MKNRSRQQVLSILALSLVLVSGALFLGASEEIESSAESTPSPAWLERTRELTAQTRAQAEMKSAGCLDCHGGIEPMHASTAVRLACTDCHGGDETVRRPSGSQQGDAGYLDAMASAHVQPRFPERWPSAANPQRSYTLLNEESIEWIRFVNPGDLRVAGETCGPCHQAQVNASAKSPMTTSSIFWAAAGYANGILGTKTALLGESYLSDGRTAAMTDPDRTEDDAARGGLLKLFPLPRWEITQPGEYFRAFERGGLLQPSFFPEIGNPLPFEEPGRPDIRLSIRGPGTGLRISPAIINLHKTRLNDPHLSFLGTNDHPGDFRSSGCTACHVVYANDRDEAHSGTWAEFGHLGQSASADPTIKSGESGHPIRHQLTRSVPTSQCMSCHMHQPNSFVNTYLGYTMWDYETDGELLWPDEQRYPSAEERRAILDRNPEGAATRGLWSDPEFLAGVSELNPQAKHTQFADYHGHGWVFRAVFSRDRAGNLLDDQGEIVSFDDPERFDKAVHLKDIHLERGMHCADCHFSRDVHGDGLIHGEYSSAIEITCQDCHGSVSEVTDLLTSGPSAPPGGTDLGLAVTPFGDSRFTWRDGNLYQRSSMTEDLEWQVPQVAHSVDPSHPDYNPKASRAKTVRRDGENWGNWGKVPRELGLLAHREEDLSCYSCHTSWMTSCSGCHLPQEANVKAPTRHYEGGDSRNYATYNPQVIRTDTFMLARHGIFKKSPGADLGPIAPMRSSSALVLSSVNANRQRFYLQQPPISTPGFSSQAFNPHVPHTVRKLETKGCTDCHLSDAGDNNAWMAQLLGQGTGWVNFIGRFAWVGLGDHGLEAVAVTEFDEPQAVIGSSLHRLAFPDDFARHQAAGGKLAEYHHHHGGGEIVSLQLRGEYLFTAKGPGGFEVFDVANVDNKDFSERIVTAPVSPLGQRTFVETSWATEIALPTTMPISTGREVDPANLETPLHPIYAYAFISDREEGLIAVDVNMLTDREPRNNFFERAWTFNPDGVLDGAESVTVAGTWIYVGSRQGLAVIDASDPTTPRLAALMSDVSTPTSIAVQFRYAFVSGPDGLSVVDVTRPDRPRKAATLALDDVRSVYVARTYAYLAAGPQGIAIIDITRPEAPELVGHYDFDGRLEETWDVKIGATNASSFAYVADASGLHVVQLTSPDTVPGYLGFSPRPEPEWIAWRPTEHAVRAISRGLDRDRAVDESGHQVSVFNRLGARPLDAADAASLYLLDPERNGEIWTVSDEPRRSATSESPERPSND